MDEVRKHLHVLTPGRHVGVETEKDDDEPFDDKMKRLVSELCKQEAVGAWLDAAITRNLEVVGFGGRGR